MLPTRDDPKFWANWLIYAVRYNAPYRHVNWLFVYADNGDAIGRKEIFSRQTVIDEIERGATFCTIHKNQNGEGSWAFGAMLRVIVVGETKYLTTAPDSSPDDDLGGLPEV